MVSVFPPKESLNEFLNKSIFSINIGLRLLVTIIINIFEFSMCALR